MGWADHIGEVNEMVERSKMEISTFKFYGEYYAIVMVQDEWTGKNASQLRKISANKTITVNGKTYDVSEYMQETVELKEFAL